jgi:hypothetical protein
MEKSQVEGIERSQMRIESRERRPWFMEKSQVEGIERSPHIAANSPVAKGSWKNPK